tara:strand:- start:2047 stop:2460 length:414 start_codon:yes stop_codon:yes gene_type:complete
MENNKKCLINELIKNDIEKNICINNVYWNIHNKLSLDSNYEDIVILYKEEINNRMDLFFSNEVDNLDLLISFDEYYKEMIKKDKFKYKNDLKKRLQIAYENEINFSCFSFFKNNNYKKKLNNLYMILSIEELNKLKN